MAGRPTAESPFRLVVEGKDDQHVITGLLQGASYRWDDDRRDRPYIHVAEGVEKLLDAASLRATLKTCRRVGLVLDADADVAARWTAIRNALGSSGIELPASPDPDGTIVPGLGLLPSSAIGVWLMPDNRGGGILETFLTRLIADGDLCLEHAREATLRARELKAPLPERDVDKGTIHAWLAWRDPPGRPFGTALTAGLLRHDTPEGRRFIAWFLRLFEGEPPIAG